MVSSELSSLKPKSALMIAELKRKRLAIPQEFLKFFQNLDPISGETVPCSKNAANWKPVNIPFSTKNRNQPKFLLCINAVQVLDNQYFHQKIVVPDILASGLFLRVMQLYLFLILPTIVRKSDFSYFDKRGLQYFLMVYKSNPLC